VTHFFHSNVLTTSYRFLKEAEYSKRPPSTNPLVDEDTSSSSDDGLGDLNEEERTVLEKRRNAELALIEKFDKKAINPRKECWFIISTKWMSKWMDYVERKTLITPGPITNSLLFERNGSLVEVNLFLKQRSSCSRRYQFPIPASSLLQTLTTAQLFFVLGMIRPYPPAETGAQGRLPRGQPFHLVHLRGALQQGLVSTFPKIPHAHGIMPRTDHQ
jgi:hypothetical protein